MAETLSQEEIDALRDAVESGDALEQQEEEAEEKGEQRKQVRVTGYNFRKPRIISGEQNQKLRLIQETFEEELGRMLASSLKTEMETKLVALDQVTYGEFILSLSNPTYLVVAGSTPGFGNIAIEVSLPVALAVTNLMLGGDGANVSDVSRELTALERNILRGVLKNLFKVLSKAWSGLVEIDYQYDHDESNPEYLQLVSRETSCINATYDVHLGDSSGVINICYPFPMVRSYFEALSDKNETADPKQSSESRERALSALSVVPVEMRAILGKSVLSAEQTASLKEGDVLCLDRKVDAPVEIYVDGNRAFLAEIGKYRGKTAVSILKSCMSGHSDMNDS